jgi:hypothetical protein
VLVVVAPPAMSMWSATASPLSERIAASGWVELTVMPAPSTTTSPLPATASTPAWTGSSRQSPQGRLGTLGRPPAVAAASARMEVAVGPSTDANAYWTWMGGVVTCTAVAPGGQPAPGSGGGAGGVQQTTSPSSSVPLRGQLASAGRSARPATLASR